MYTKTMSNLFVPFSFDLMMVFYSFVLCPWAFEPRWCCCQLRMTAFERRVLYTWFICFIICARVRRTIYEYHSRPILDYIYSKMYVTHYTKMLAYCETVEEECGRWYTNYTKCYNMNKRTADHRKDLNKK